MRVLSVSQINFFIKSLIEGDGRMRDIYARGEISNFTCLLYTSPSPRD